MPETIHNAKDNSMKKILGEPELFIEFLHDYVPIDIFEDVTEADIEDISERYIPLFQDSKESDTVKRVNLKGGTPLFVIAIVEHESQVNFRTSFKMLQYITLVLTEHEKDVNKEAAKNKLKAKDGGNAEDENKDDTEASSAKGFKYPPVLPIVFYDGKASWTAETNFLDKTELSGVFEKYIPKFEYELVDLNEYDEKDFVRFGNTLSLIMVIDKIRTAEVEKLKALAIAKAMLIKGMPIDMVMEITGIGLEDIEPLLEDAAKQHNESALPPT